MSHYEKEYFDWQKEQGKFGGLVESRKFQQFIKETDNVLDFGSGGGYVLKNLHCKGKMGIEINDTARGESENNGIHAVKSAAEVPDNWADVIISNHALEHTFHPLEEIRALYPKLKKGGQIIICTPMEKSNPYKAEDINQHLHTWSEMNLGNLFTLAGFKVHSVREVKHKWPPHYQAIYRRFGKTVFDIACKVWARYKWRISQIILVGSRET